MNIKERGITVGDLLIITIIILITTFIIKTFKNDKKTTFNISNQQDISYKINSSSKKYLNSFTL